jgi:hypothetical protein
MSALYPNVPSMLAAYGVTAPAVPFAHDGYSGATMERIDQDGEPYILKRVSRTDDWIIQMTSDHAFREAQIAASNVLEPLAPSVRSPSIAAAQDRDGFALLMHDLAPVLLPPDGVLPDATWDLIMSRVAQMHATFWDAPPTDDLGWCGLSERLLMLSEPAAERLREAGLMEFGFATGWERFHDLVPPHVSALVRALHADPAPLVDACQNLPRTLIHNDVKVANMALEGETLWLFDWALAGIGPAAMDVAWLLTANSSRLSWSLVETLDRYAGHLRAALGSRFDTVAWESQCAVVYISGLIMFGWAKWNDPAELTWWCERALEARALLRL